MFYYAKDINQSINCTRRICICAYEMDKTTALFQLQIFFVFVLDLFSETVFRYFVVFNLKRKVLKYELKLKTFETL